MGIVSDPVAFGIRYSSKSFYHRTWRPFQEELDAELAEFEVNNDPTDPTYVKRMRQLIIDRGRELKQSTGFFGGKLAVNAHVNDYLAQQTARFRSASTRARVSERDKDKAEKESADDIVAVAEARKTVNYLNDLEPAVTQMQRDILKNPAQAHEIMTKFVEDIKRDTPESLRPFIADELVRASFEALVAGQGGSPLPDFTVGTDATIAYLESQGVDGTQAAQILASKIEGDATDGLRLQGGRLDTYLKSAPGEILTKFNEQIQALSPEELEQSRPKELLGEAIDSLDAGISDMELSPAVTALRQPAIDALKDILPRQLQPIIDERLQQEHNQQVDQWVNETIVDLNSGDMGLEDAITAISGMDWDEPTQFAAQRQIYMAHLENLAETEHLNRNSPSGRLKVGAEPDSPRANVAGFTALANAMIYGNVDFESEEDGLFGRTAAPDDRGVQEQEFVSRIMGEYESSWEYAERGDTASLKHIYATEVDKSPLFKERFPEFKDFANFIDTHEEGANPDLEFYVRKGLSPKEVESAWHSGIKKGEQIVHNQILQDRESDERSLQQFAEAIYEGRQYAGPPFLLPETAARANKIRNDYIAGQEKQVAFKTSLDLGQTIDPEGMAAAGAKLWAAENVVPGILGENEQIADNVFGQMLNNARPTDYIPTNVISAIDSLTTSGNPAKVVRAVKYATAIHQINPALGTGLSEGTLHLMHYRMQPGVTDDVLANYVNESRTFDGSKIHADRLADAVGPEGLDDPSFLEDIGEDALGSLWFANRFDTDRQDSRPVGVIKRLTAEHFKHVMQIEGNIERARASATSFVQDIAGPSLFGRGVQVGSFGNVSPEQLANLRQEILNAAGITPEGMDNYYGPEGNLWLVPVDENNQPFLDVNGNRYQLNGTKKLKLKKLDDIRFERQLGLHTATIEALVAGDTADAAVDRAFRGAYNMSLVSSETFNEVYAGKFSGNDSFVKANLALYSTPTANADQLEFLAKYSHAQPGQFDRWNVPYDIANMYYIYEWDYVTLNHVMHHYENTGEILDNPVPVRRAGDRPSLPYGRPREID